MTKKQLSQLHQKAEKAMREAVQKVIEEHRKAGTSMSIWKNGRVEKVKASKLKI